MTEILPVRRITRPFFINELERNFILLICTVEKDLCIRHSNFGSIQLGFTLGTRKSAIQSIHTLLWFDQKVMICRKMQ